MRFTSTDITILTAHLQAGQNGQSVLLPGIGLTFAVSREMNPERSGWSSATLWIHSAEPFTLRILLWTWIVSHFLFSLLVPLGCDISTCFNYWFKKPHIMPCDDKVGKKLPSKTNESQPWYSLTASRLVYLDCYRLALTSYAVWPCCIVNGHFLHLPFYIKSGFMFLNSQKLCAHLFF